MAGSTINDLNKRLSEVLGEYLTLLRSTEVYDGASSPRQQLLASLESTDTSEVIHRALFRRIVQTIAEGHAAFESELGASAIRIDHIAIAVRDLEDAITYFTERYGFRLADRGTIRGAESSMMFGVLVAGAVTFVLVMGLDDRSNVSKYIEHYGPGVQHVAIQVDGLKRILGDLNERHADMLTDIVRAPGLLQAFTRRDQNSGIQLELVERVSTGDFDEENITRLYDAMDQEDVF